jgi:hypothetical protein
LRTISDSVGNILLDFRNREPLEIAQEHLNKGKSSIVEEWHSRCSVHSPRPKAGATAVPSVAQRHSKQKNNEEGSGTMSTEKPVNTTLGELIVAVTDQVAPLTVNRVTTNALVSYILQDLFLKRRVRLRKRSALRRVD